MPETEGVSIPGVKTPSLPDLGAAPDFTDTQQWFNTPGGAPLSLATLRGHVVLVDFWTYTCINCIRTLPFVEGLYKTYHRTGSRSWAWRPRSSRSSRTPSNVKQAIHSDGLTLPSRAGQQVRHLERVPEPVLAGGVPDRRQGQVRHTQFGEGNYKEDEAAVRQLLHEAGARRLPPPMTAHAIMPSEQLATPETYLDDQRSQGFAQPLKSGVRPYAGAATCSSTSSRSRAAGASPTSPRRRVGKPRPSRATCRPPTCTW